MLPFMSLRFLLVRTLLFIDVSPGILRITAMHHLPCHMCQCASTFSSVAFHFSSEHHMRFFILSIMVDLLVKRHSGPIFFVINEDKLRE